MRLIKNIFSKMYLFLIWIILSTMVWGWIFNLVTDTSVDKKVTLFIEAPAVNDVEIAVYLEQDMPHGIKMVKVHPFSYAMINADLLLNADFYIIKESNIDQYLSDLAPIDGLIDTDGYDIYYVGAVPYGIKVFDSSSGIGIGAGNITYYNEDCYLFFGAHSSHIGDGAAASVAERLLELK